MQLPATLAVNTQLYGYLERGSDPITCDDVEPGFLPRNITVTPPLIYSISGLQEPVSWTPYLYQWDGASQRWVYAVRGATLAQTAFGKAGSGNSLMFLYGYGSMQNGFTVGTAGGWFRVADYVVWNQYPSTTYAWDWAGTHHFLYTSLLGFGSAVYADWCYFPPVGAAAARQAPPPADAAPPTRPE